MNHFYFKSLFTALLLLCSSVASAHDFEVDGIFYKIISSSDFTVKVSYKSNSYASHDNEYSGNVVIPDKVTYNGTSYSVTTIGNYAFYDCSNLTSVTIPNSVNSIGDSAFEDCDGLTSVTIGNSVTSIGDYAFDNCSGLTSIVIPNSVTSIGDCAFSYCSGLTSITVSSGNRIYNSRGCNAIIETATNKLIIGCKKTIIPNSVTTIGSCAFYGCTGLTSITIPNSVTSIGSSAFSNCNSLKSVIIGNSVTSIGSYAFYDCDGLTNVTIPNSVTTIGDGAFYDCDNLASVTIGNGVKSVGSYAFYACDGLKSVIIGNGVTSIGDYAFYWCTSLKELRIEDGEGILFLGSNGNKGMFANCPLKTLYLGRNLSYSTGSSSGYSPFYSITTLKSVTVGNSVTSIGSYAFYDCYNLASVTIGNSVTSIGEYAFYFSDLTSITIPNSVTSIGKYAFYYCSGLKEVHITDLAAWFNIDFGDFRSNPLYYAHNLYLNGEKVADLVIPDGVTTIKNYAFSGCSGLTSVTIPESVTSIGEDAFCDCSGLTSITIPNSVTSIGEDAFCDCSGLTSITIPNSVTSIGEYAFEYCSGLKEVHISDLAAWFNIDFGYINSNPLYYAHNLYLNGEKVADLVIPDGVTTIKNYAFSGCSGLTSIETPNSVTSIGHRAFYGCDGLAGITILGSVTSIGEYAFDDCNNIKKLELNCAKIESWFSGDNYNSLPIEELIIGDNTTEIGERAFCNMASLAKVTIGKNVKVIRNEVFSGCNAIETIYAKGEKPALVGENNFTMDQYLNVKLYVPAGSLHKYEISDVWENFWEIEEFCVVNGDINSDDEVNVGDFAALVNVIFASEVDEAQQARADINEDGEVNVGDFAALVNLIFGGSSNAAPKKAAATRATTGEHRLYIEPFNIAPGERAEIAVLMENTGDKFSQMQFDLTLPEGISIVQEFDEELFGDVPLIKHGSRTSSKAYDITCRPEGDGVKIMCATENINAYFLRESGDVLLITVEAAADLAFGTYELTISNSVLARQDDSTYKPASETAEITVCDLTGIDSIEAEDGAAEIYDIYGRRVTEPVKGGVYIVNGKKVVVE